MFGRRVGGALAIGLTVACVVAALVPGTATSGPAAVRKQTGEL
jgi:hypothetical protein